MIDSHFHLDHEPLYENLNDVLIRSKDIGITKILTICTTLNSFKKIKTIIKKDEMIYGTYGIHPHETQNDSVDKKTIVEAIKETLNLSWTLVGLIIATLTLTGQAQQVTAIATIITLAVWLLTIGFRK